MRTKLIHFILLCLALFPFFFWIYKYINVDLWYDEVYSLQNFALGSFANTLLYYPLPNNHVFFNFTSQLISRLLGVRSISQIADHVYIFRLFQAIITFFTAYYSLQIVKRFFKLDYNLLVILILFTTIPFMNFSLQLRGYNISSLFLVMIVYHSWAFIEKEEQRDKIFIIVSSALLIYTIPSNIYMLASILVTFFLYSIYYKKLKKKDVRTYYKAIIFIVLGIGIAIILYLPILKNIIFNEFSTREASSIFYSLELMPKLFLAFLSKRYLLVILFIIGCWLFVRQSEQKEKKLHFFLLLIFLIPFILSFIHQKFPFQRVFISLSPIFSILITVPILFSIQKIKNSSLKKYFAFIVTIYCIVVFLYEMKNNDIEISNKLVTKGEITQDIYQNYYLSSSFNQSETMKYLKSISGNKDVFLYNQIDYPSTYLYLTINEVNFTAVESKKKLEQIILNNDTTILLSSFKSELSNELNNINEIETTVLMDKYPITNIIRVTKK